MPIQKRNKPKSATSIIVTVLIGVGIVMIGGVGQSDTFMGGDAGRWLVMIAGVGVVIWALFQWGTLGVFHRSSNDAQAKVIRLFQEERVDYDGDTYYIYHAVIEFRAHQSDIGDKDVILDAVVEKQVYDRLEPYTTTIVRYATEDPQIALIEGEFKG